MIDSMTWTPVENHGFMQLLGTIMTCDQDASKFRFLVRPEHVNRYGFAHGGMLMTLSDHAMAITARGDDTSRAATTVQFDMHFMRAVSVEDTIDITCHVGRQTRSLVFMEAKLSVRDKVVANAKGVWKIVLMPSKGHE